MGFAGFASFATFALFGGPGSRTLEKTRGNRENSINVKYVFLSMYMICSIRVA